MCKHLIISTCDHESGNEGTVGTLATCMFMYIPDGCVDSNYIK